MLPKIYLERDRTVSIMLQKRLKQAHLAKACDISESTITKALRGESVALETAEAIAKVLGVHVREIIRSAPASVPMSPSTPSDISSAVEKLQRIYQARQSHDPDAAQAWEWINGNLTMFCKGLENSPIRNAIHAEGKEPKRARG
jgi:transcriptional regulator with XRE-family HTH domain